MQSQDPLSLQPFKKEESSSFHSQDIPCGRWNEQDSLRFVAFIYKFHHIFNSKHQRKSFKIFKVFSHYFTKRTPSQCRSRFQKLILKHKTVPKLKRFYVNKFGQNAFQAQMRLLEQFSLWKEIQNERQKVQAGSQTQPSKADCNASSSFSLHDYNSFWREWSKQRWWALNYSAQMARLSSPYCFW